MSLSTMLKVSFSVVRQPRAYWHSARTHIHCTLGHTQDKGGCIEVGQLRAVAMTTVAMSTLGTF